jgi:dihydroorotase
MRSTVLLAAVLTLAAGGARAIQAQPTYDLLLKNGLVIDPRNGIDTTLDVAILAGKVARVASDISAAEARQVVDVRGMYVSPGTVDLHAHVFYGTDPDAYLSDGISSVPPDGFTFRAGVTTVVDAGGAGWRNFHQFKRQVIDRSRTRVLSFLNIVGHGMKGGAVEQDLNDMDARLTAQRVRQFPGVIVGIKTAHYRGPEWDAVDRSVEAGRLAGVPVMVDFGTFGPNRPFEALVLEHLRPGDIYTHQYRGDVPMLDANGKVRDYLFEARKRGVLFDVGHGSGSFSFSQAVPAVAQGFVPDSLGTDLHTSSMTGGMKDMATLMSKFLNLRMSLKDVILRIEPVEPDREGAHGGVTTVVDAGGAGWRNFPRFKSQVIDRSRTRVLAFLNIVGSGLKGGPIEQNLGDMDAKLTAARARQFPGLVVGVKTAHYSGPEWAPVDRAVEAGKQAGIPVMVDFGQFVPERPFEELVTRRLRPGDIYTHTFLGRVPMLDGNGKLRPYLAEAQKRGVIFDVGHGGGSFLFRQAVPATRQGFWPDTISTDIHTGSMNAGMKDMRNAKERHEIVSRYYPSSAAAYRAGRSDRLSRGRRGGPACHGTRAVHVFAGRACGNWQAGPRRPQGRADFRRRAVQAGPRQTSVPRVRPRGSPLRSDREGSPRQRRDRRRRGAAGRRSAPTCGGAERGRSHVGRFARRRVADGVVRCRRADQRGTRSPAAGPQGARAGVHELVGQGHARRGLGARVPRGHRQRLHGIQGESAPVVRSDRTVQHAGP